MMQILPVSSGRKSNRKKIFVRIEKKENSLTFSTVSASISVLKSGGFDFDILQ
jgi:hypothetical protein